MYEDDFCLVVNKPAGMAVHPDNESRETTLNHVVAAYYEAEGFTRQSGTSIGWIKIRRVPCCMPRTNMRS